MDDDAPDVLNKNSVMRIRTSAHKFSTGTNNPVKNTYLGNRLCSEANENNESQNRTMHMTPRILIVNESVKIQEEEVVVDGMKR